MSSLFPQGIKDLKISAPTNVGVNNSTLRCKVIVVVKFDFNAETDRELSVKKGDVLKLLDRLSNGWVFVEFIDKIASPGLVPSLYVDIAVNDPLNPVTLLWLHAGAKETKIGQAGPVFNDVQVQKLLEKNTPFSINNQLYPLSVSVANYLMFENRFWYRVDVTYSLGQQGYLCRYYLDFYDLHLSLLEYVNGAGPDTSENPDKPESSGWKLPKLPEPVPSQRRNSTEQKELFSARCRELSSYIHDLISTKRFQACPAIVDWLDVAYKDLPGFVVDDAPQDPGDVINQRILPGSVILASKSVPSSASESAKDAPLDTVKFAPSTKDTERMDSLKNVYNHYRQAANAKINIARSLSTLEGRYPTRNKPLERAKTVSNATHTPKREALVSTPVSAMSPPLHKLKSVSLPLMTPQHRIRHDKKQTRTPPQTVKSPPTPLQVSFPTDITPNGTNNTSYGLHTPQLASGAQFTPHHVSFGTPTSRKPPKTGARRIKCDIKTQSNDHIVVRVQVSEYPTLEEFKAAVYLKFAFNNLYIRAQTSGNYEEIDSPDLDPMDTILEAETVSLLVT